MAADGRLSPQRQGRRQEAACAFSGSVRRRFETQHCDAGFAGAGDGKDLCRTSANAVGV
jgi:hypothetical protein